MTDGFFYDLEDDKIKDYIKLSVEDKLMWLEEIHEFTFLFMDENSKRVHQAFRGK